MRFLPSHGCVITTVWMHYLDSYKTHGEKARWKLYKIAMCCFVLILEATSHKTPAVWPHASHFTN